MPICSALALLRSKARYYPAAGLLLSISIVAQTYGQDVPRGVAQWDAKLGNARAQVYVPVKSDVAIAKIEWRRRDRNPERKNIVVIDESTGLPIKNVVRGAINREYGQIAFEPAHSPGEYDVYYMPFDTAGSPFFPVVTYPPFKDSADPDWLTRNHLAPADFGSWSKFVRATVKDIQSRGDFNRPDPMEVIATKSETWNLLQAHPNTPYLAFPEDRFHAIRMTDDLPERWVRRNDLDIVSASASRGQFLTFQVGIWAARSRVDNLQVKFSALQGPGKSILQASAFRCFEAGGTDWLGRKFAKQINVDNGKIAALWIGTQIPSDVRPGMYSGIMELLAKGEVPAPIKLRFLVTPDVALDSGDRDPHNMSRLRWLDSTIGLDDEVVKPYIPLKVQGTTVACLGRTVKFGGDGLPSSILVGNRELLAGPLTLAPEISGKPLSWSATRALVVIRKPGATTLSAMGKAGPFTMSCVSKMEADGYVNFQVDLVAHTKVQVSDVRLDIPFQRSMATYLMGMGRKGGLRPASWRWDWNQGYANNMVWMGDVEGGLQCKLKGPTDTWDLFRLSSIPDSWSNRGRGGCLISEVGKGEYLLRAYSGAREFQAGQSIRYRFGLLITPVKPLDPAHWRQRYDHEYIPPEKAKENGATIINIHQGNELNPYINYPFLTSDKLASYVKTAHSLGLKVKIYYTVRELSNRVVEMWALRSLGYEVFTDGNGGGDSWLQEHLVSHYKPAWHNPLPDGSIDAAITTAGLSRWHNYYLEGLRWLIQNAGIDGLYLDGLGYDREIMKRVRKVLDRTKPGCLIDYHCGNSFQPQYGMNSCANEFMEHFPYIDSLWFGEGYDYNESPDYWLVEVSGIPFGLYGEMLENNGNPWRGMVYGMTARYYSGADPKHIWKLWDDFGIDKAKMIGYWSPTCPVRTDDPSVLATAYVRNGKTLVALASWDKSRVQVRLKIDWKALGLDPRSTTISAPEVPGFQLATTFSPDQTIDVQPGKGWMLVLSQNDPVSRVSGGPRAPASRRIR